MLCLLCTGIKRVQREISRLHLPTTINILKALKPNLILPFSWEMAALVCLHTSLLWVPQSQRVHLIKPAIQPTPTAVTFYHIPESVKNKPIQTWIFHHSANHIHINLFSMVHQDFHWSNCRISLLYQSGYFNPLSWKQLIRVLHSFLRLASHEHHSYVNHSFRIGAATTAAAAGLPAWLTKVMGWWSSDAYQT